MFDHLLNLRMFIILAGFFLAFAQTCAEEKSAGVVRLGCSGRFEPDWGLVLEHVDPISIAHQMGLKRGDVIVEINGASLRSLGHYYRLLNNSRGRIQFTIEEASSRKLISRALKLQVQHGELQASVIDVSNHAEVVARGNR